MSTMNETAPPRSPLGIMIAIACAALYVLGSSLTLPALVASHFDAAGQPNGFMPRGVYIGVMLALVIGVPLLLALLPGRLMRQPEARINLPHREYWLAPARRAATIATLERQGGRFALLVLGFLCYAHGLVVLANHASPPVLPSAWFVGGVVMFLLAVLGWVVALMRRFRNVPH